MLTFRERSCVQPRPPASSGARAGNCPRDGILRVTLVTQEVCRPPKAEFNTSYVILLTAESAGHMQRRLPFPLDSWVFAGGIGT